jgi:serine/threonine protein phosphatase PrpC
MLEPTQGQTETTRSQKGQRIFLVGQASDPGRVRDRNQDASLVWQFQLAQHGEPPLPMGLFIVADGMGGQMRGEQASALAIRLAAEHVVRQVCLPLLSDDPGIRDRPPINEVLESSVRIAHQAVLRRLPEAGTTLTMALLMGDVVYLAHVGDSRAYLGGRGHIRCLTEDHSIAARLMAMGKTTPQEVAEQRHLLYKAVGQGPQIEPDVTYHDMSNEQYLLLCSDGLWGLVPDEEIVGIVDPAPTPDCACRNLVDQANRNGGDDNVSVILVARDWPPPPQQAA